MEIEGKDKQPDGSSKDWPFSYFKFDKERDSPEQVRSSIMVVAALVVAATYQAVMSPPDGLKGKSRYTQLIFIYVNTLAWSSSITILAMLTSSFSFQRELLLSYWSMGLAYGVIVGELADINSGVGYITLSLCLLAPLLIRWVPIYISNIANKCRVK